MITRPLLNILLYCLYLFVFCDASAKDTEKQNRVLKYDFSTGYSQLANDIIPSVVSVTSTKVVQASKQDIAKLEQFEELFNFFGIPNSQMLPNKENKSIVVGSGFFISDEYIVTNYHVVENATSIEIKNYKLQSRKSTLIAFDKQTDIALLKVDTKGYDFAVLPFGDSNLVNVGDFSFVVGNPFGLGSSLTSGIISARGRNISDIPYSDYIQTDAAINRGNSGGPLFNIYGEIIGISTAIYTPSGGNVGIGFAIPSNTAKDIIERLIKNKKIVRAWLGIGISEVDDKIKESTMYKGVNGAFVSKVYDASPAKKFGIKEMDIITSVDGKQIEHFNMLPLIISQQPVGKKVNITVWRFGKEIKFSPILEQLEEVDTEEQNKQENGILIAKKTASVAGLNVSNTQGNQGVVVDYIDKTSPVFSSALKEGMVITKINGEDVKTVDDFVKQIQTSIQQSKNTVLLKVKDRENENIIPVKIANEK